MAWRLATARLGAQTRGWAKNFHETETSGQQRDGGCHLDEGVDEGEDGFHAQKSNDAPVQHRFGELELRETEIGGENQRIWGHILAHGMGSCGGAGVTRWVAGSGWAKSRLPSRSPGTSPSANEGRKQPNFRAVFNPITKYDLSAPLPKKTNYKQVEPVRMLNWVWKTRGVAKLHNREKNGGSNRNNLMRLQASSSKR